MSAESMIANLRWGMETLPFPALLLYVIALGLLWLFVESLLTRTARATPGWRKPFPVLPWISEVAAWVTRGSSWLLWTWAVLYFVLVAVHWSAAQDAGANLAGISEALLGLADAWQRVYSTLVGVLPPVLQQVLPGI